MERFSVGTSIAPLDPGEVVEAVSSLVTGRRGRDDGRQGARLRQNTIFDADMRGVAAVNDGHDHDGMLSLRTGSYRTPSHA